MGQTAWSNLHLRLDNLRVKLHFKAVEAKLRATDIDHLSCEQQVAREHYLDVLHQYATRGIFPRNAGRLGYSPCFIDHDRRECAVAHLIITAGQTELAHKIAEHDNYAYVQQMNFPELDDWAIHSGFSREELALIQPGYWNTLTDTPLLLALLIWVIGVIAAIATRLQIVQKRKEIIIPALSLVVTIALFFVGYYCLDGATTAYFLGTHPDGYPYDLPLRDVPGLVSGFLLSLALAVIVGHQSLHLLRNFFSSPGKRGH